jgi:hypothetical protein
MAWPIIAAVAGAAIGGFSSLISRSKQAQSLQQQKENAWQKYLINKEFGDFQFNTQKGEVFTSLGIQQQRLGEDLNAGVGNFNLGLLGQAYGIQDAQMSLAAQLGAYDVSQGASGTRGNEANGLVKAYAQTSFDRNLDLQRQQTGQQLEGMITGANRTSQDLVREQESWGEGGYRTQLYAAEDERNRKLALLGQSEYDSAISAARPGVFDFLTGGLMGASSGLQLGSSIQNAQTYSNQQASSSSSAVSWSSPSFSLGGESYGGYASTSLGRLNVNSFNSIGGRMK